MKMLLVAAALAAASILLFSQSTPVFLEKPYLQLGNSPKLAAKESLTLLWHTGETPAPFTVEVKGKIDKSWRVAAKPVAQTVDAPEVGKHLVYRAEMTGLTPGEPFQYRVLKSGTEGFTAKATARKSVSQPYKFVLFGDCAQDTPGQRAVAFEAAKTNPDFLFITGDIVYNAGRISEYRTKFFPVYAADTASRETGAPLLQSVPFLATPGNHDSALGNFNRFPDALAYFLYWDQPLNGPGVTAGPKTSHALNGNVDTQAKFLAGAKPRYPVMANYSFDYGNSHWTVLDSNPYMDWNNPELRAWVEKDLAGASNATWRFVAFHHPGFNSSTSHFYDQWMRYLTPVFEKGVVDVVFSGHVHNYQRTFPLTFTPKGETGPRGEVDGAFNFDTQFADGATAKPRGIIYIVSGAGGAGLYNPELQATPEKWQIFTDKYIADQNSFSAIEVDGKKFKFRQIGADGKKLDAFQIIK